VVALICVIVGGLAGVVAANYADIDRYISNGLILATVGAFKYSVSSLEAAAEQATSVEQKAEAEIALGLVYYQAAQDAIESGKSPNAYLAKAREHYAQAVELDVDNAFLYGQIGDIYLAMSDLEQARDAYEKALVYEPDAVVAHYGLARVEIRLKQTEAAVSHLEKVVKTSPDHIKASILLAEQLIELGRVDEAIEKLKAAESFDPRVPELHYQLARAYRAQGDWEKALHELERTLQLDPNHKQASLMMRQLRKE